MSNSYTNSNSNNTDTSSIASSHKSLPSSWKNHPVPECYDYTHHIQQDMVVQIPRVMPYCGGVAVSNQYIRNVFADWGFGDIKQCDWKGPYQLNRPDGSVVHTYWEVYVYFNSWGNSRDTAKLQGHMKTKDKTILHYDDTNYWIVNECHNPMTERERLIRDENRKLKCDLFDNDDRLNQTIAYYEGLVAQRDEYIAKYIDNLENATNEDELHDLNLPDINGVFSNREYRDRGVSPPPSPGRNSSASVESPPIRRTDAREDSDEGPDTAFKLQRTMSTRPT